MSETTTNETEIAEAKRTILKILRDDPTFQTSGVLTAKIGELFKKEDSKSRSFKDIFPTTTVTQFMRDYLAEDVHLTKDPSNPIRIYARSPVAAPAQLPEVASPIFASKVPRKLFKLRVFLLALSDEERKKFSVDGSLLLSLLKDET